MMVLEVEVRKAVDEGRGDPLEAVLLDATKLEPETEMELGCREADDGWDELLWASILGITELEPCPCP